MEKESLNAVDIVQRNFYIVFAFDYVAFSLAFPVLGDQTIYVEPSIIPIPLTS